MPRAAPQRLSEKVRRRLGAAVTDGFFTGALRGTGLLPWASPRLHGVEVTRDVRYGPHGEAHTLDVYRPKGAAGPLPVVLYVHGGGFRILSKESHWLFGLKFARRGFAVVNINYRLAPRHPFPAAIEDACAAYVWLVQRAAALGVDVSRLVLAGESAGANLVTALSLAACAPRPEAFARAVFDLGVVPRAVVAAYGLLQVSDVRRFEQDPAVSTYVHDRLREVEDDYLRGAHAPHGLDLADPLTALERGQPLARPLPPFFAPCGDRDVLLDDSQRLARALTRLGGHCEAPVYRRGVHGFHIVFFTPSARRCWRDLDAFLAAQLGAARDSRRAS